MYTALEAKLRSDPRLPSDVDPRSAAVGVHLASLGYATMASHLAGAKDKMKRPFEDYAEAVAAILARGLGG